MVRRCKRRANGEAALRKRSDGHWEDRYTVGRDPGTGKAIYKKLLNGSRVERSKSKNQPKGLGAKVANISLPLCFVAKQHPDRKSVV